MPRSATTFAGPTFAIWRTRWIDPVAADFAAHHVPRQDLPTLVETYGDELNPETLSYIAMRLRQAE